MSPSISADSSLGDSLNISRDVLAVYLVSLQTGIGCVIGRDLRDTAVLERTRTTRVQLLVNFAGEKVAAVCANDEDTAEHALALIDVVYESPLPLTLCL